MRYILCWLPFIINLFLIPSDLIFIFTLPIALFIGLIILAIYDSCKMKQLENEGRKNTAEYRKYKQDRDIAFVGMIGGIVSGLKNTKKCIKDISDVDHWNTKI